MLVPSWDRSRLCAHVPKATLPHSIITLQNLFVYEVNAWAMVWHGAVGANACINYKSIPNALMALSSIDANLTVLVQQSKSHLMVSR